ncbi:MAG: type I methionyl aminopeptidase [Clostridia bacterium]|nr:type I methionyl aminopeptidase [Clostridia bacterium]
MISIKNEHQIQLMEESAVALKAALKAIEKNIRPGVSTLYLNDVAQEAMLAHGAIPAFKGVPCPYKGGKSYKWAICTSVNDEIIHGIPSSSVILKEGDIVSVDLGTYKNGWASDAGRTYAVGKISPIHQKLIDVAKDAFFVGINEAVPGNRVGDISNAIQTYVEKQGFSLLREFQGHGIGEDMHEDPGVPNIGKKGTGPRLQAGMALAIEPMICEGKPDVYVKRDLWTIATMDKKMTSYYENTIVITNDGVKILTLD